MRVLISGGAGFIGSHLCDFFIQQNNEVICVDNFITGQQENISHLLGNPKFHFINADVSEPLTVDLEVSAILHFASPASPKDFTKYPIQIMRANGFGTYHLLELARRKQARFLLASTSEIYGDPLVHPQSENYWGNVNPIGVRSVYDESKRFAEALAFAYKRKFGIAIRIARIFNTYGPRMRVLDGRVVPNLILRALRGEPLTIYGDGSQTRSFCYIDDMVCGIVKLLDADISEPVNLGNPDEFTILELANLIIELTGTKSSLEFIPLPQDDPKKRKPDISKAKRLLSWEPKVSLRQGLKKTIDWFKQQTAYDKA
uniref:UDP-glucuronate decarboxylase n=1 Tax=candidate division WOR-3 bacterium TaxID=2052148 RepID=A0A7C6EDN2_UNCW3